ncbi:hypothetical protein [Ferruginibacter sp. HRS2-29]|uniref:hypothetical protein n=1 Tax=Ferruginibacter sp. HRS2-29 TaxID=2487334 RepID=UPI0020CBD11C|nr:hypothetical protein [Ferruginibacter sp. HRS2-29]MCP9750414.1 hypothetical protein [Ferruginibacter sp. HRS2-29]
MRFLFLVLVAFCCTMNVSAQSGKNVITSDIDNFWKAYDVIISTKDSAAQYDAIQKMYIDKGTPGLKSIMEERQYTAKSYIDAINNYPAFWNSVRKSTYRSEQFGESISAELVKLKKLYPGLKPANIYFTIGALRTSGTVANGHVLIGAELALTDSNTVASEFPGAMSKNRRRYFDSNPVNDVVLLNVHEYVHTQQYPPVDNLLSYCVREGVAEFVSVKATGKPSSTPAIAFGKKNTKAVRAKFEADMFSLYKRDEWLWSDAPNKFDVRDLGYYIGYAICEKYYQRAADKSKAIKEMIELDYSNENAFGKFVESSGYLSASLDKLYNKFQKARPVATGVKEFRNGSQDVDPALTFITVRFSQKMDTRFRSTGLGALGKDHFPKVSAIKFSADGMSVTYEVKLEPGKEYQLILENGYRSVDALQLKQYEVHFKTSGTPLTANQVN